MVYEVIYTHPSEQPIRVMYPEGGCPFIPQSSYTFGARARIDMCSNVNHAVYSTYCALAGAHPSTFPGAPSRAQAVASNLIDVLMVSIGYKRGAEEPRGMEEL